MSTPSSHPGLGEPTDISAEDLDLDAPPTPASEDPAQRRDDELGSGDGVDVQPGGAG